MVLYTEKQLRDAWHCHCAELVYSNQESLIQVDLPSLEDFRSLYEERLEELLDDNTS